MTSPTTTRPSQEQATHDLLRGLLAVRGWVRDSSRTIHAERTPAALLVLALLEHHGPARVGELAELAKVDASVVSRQLTQLEQDRLVTRSADPRDGRAQLLSLSDAGARELGRGQRELERVVAQRLAGWTPEELSAFVATLQRLLGDLSAT